MSTFSAVAEHAVGETPPTDGLTLTAQAATFILSAQADFARAEISEPAAFVLSAQEAGLAGTASAGTFTLAAQPAGLDVVTGADPAAFVLGTYPAQIAWVHGAANFVLSAQAGVFGAALHAAPAAFILAAPAIPTDVDLGATLLSAQGAVGEYAVGEFPEAVRFGTFAQAATFVLSAQALAFRAEILSETAEFELTGGPAQIGFRHDHAVFSLSGQNAGLSTAFAAETGSFTLTLSSAQSAWAHDGASFTLAGQPVGLNPLLDAEAAGFALSVQQIFVGIRTQPGGFVLSGHDIFLSPRIGAEVAAFTLTAPPVDLLNIFKLYPEPGVFTLTGQEAGRAYTLGPETAQFTLSGLATFTVAQALGPGTFTLAGGDSGFGLALKLATGQFTLIGWNVVDALGPSGDHIFLVEVKAHDGSQELTFYLGTDDFTSAPNDSPANQYYASRVSDPGNFERMLFSQGETRGRSSVGTGDIKINSGDPGNGELIDDWLSYGWSGRSIKIMALPRGARSLAAASTLFVGRLDRLTATRPLDEFSLAIADRLADLDKPLLTTLFAGTTTSTAATAEGNADLKGQIKQRCYGAPKEVPVQPANPYDLIYLVSNGALQSVALYDGGVALTNDGDEPDIAALRGASIAPGHFRTCLALGLVRLGGTPIMTVTADPVEGATDAERTAAQIARRMLVDLGIPPNEIITGAFDALDEINDAAIGYFVSDDRSALAAVQDVLDSVGGWMSPGRDGSLAVGRHNAPVASSTGLIFDVDSQSIGETLDRVDGEIPVYRVTLQYARVNTVQADSALAGAVSAERRAYLASEWRSVVAEDLAVKTKHLNAREIVVTTFLISEADAQAEADRLLDLYKAERERYEVSLPLSDAWAGDVGLTMTLVHPRLGFAGGKPFSILGRVDDYQSERVRFSLWG